MANLLQSSQTKSTCAPSYYTNYLQNIACKGQAAECAAQFAGAQPLQTAAFCEVAKNQGAEQPVFAKGVGYVGCAANQNITGAAAPYLQQATSRGGLCAANPYLAKASGTCSAQLAQSYMSPYINSAVQNMSDIAQRNIQQNLSPAATAAAVGSGQFGSQRGAQVLGQIQANAEQCLNSQIANLENAGYTNALNAATQKQQICAGIGSTAGTLAQQQQNLTEQAGATAANAASQQASALNQAGSTLGSLGTQAGTQNLACINAEATLGGQQQTIAQNAQCYPLVKLSKLSGLLQGANIPSTVKTTMCSSPLSAAATAASGLKALTCSSIGCKLSCWYNNLTKCASGGLVGARAGGIIGCRSTSHMGALPVRRT
jgi:hypothetical protein